MLFSRDTFIQLCVFSMVLTGWTYSQRTGTLERILKNYDPQLPPDYDSGVPVSISVQLAVLSIDSIDETKMDYSMTMYLRQTWVDDRLKYAPFNVTVFAMTYQNLQMAGPEQVEKANGGASNSGMGAPPHRQTLQNAHGKGKAKVKEGKLELDVHAMDKIWVPDTFFYNERDAIFHDVTVPNKLLHIYSNGTVFYSMRVSLTLTCHMDLSKYPFDRQTCLLQLGTYGYTEEILAYFWHIRDPVTFPRNLILPTFQLYDWHLENCDEEEFDGVNVGQFSCLNMVIKLARSYGFYVAQIYVPSVLVVILSWVSFWLDIEAIPARISLGLLTVLTMTTMSVGARSSLPRVSYLKALDVWNAACLLFVFSALLEFAYVNVTTRVEKRRLSMRDAVNLARGKENNAPKTQLTVASRQRARLVDKMARIIFPATFLAFNAFYWCFYMI